MKRVDFLIIGGSAAGTTAAEVIRSNLPDSSITIVTDEVHEQYSRVLLPHYIRGKVNRDQVFLKKPGWYGEQKIELIKGVRVKGLGVKDKIVELESGEQIKFGKLLIAIGGYVIPLKVPGSDLENILYMRTVENADKTIETARKSKKAVIIGGGFIGLEFTSCFKMNGVQEVTVLVKEDFYWQGKLDRGSSTVLQNTLEKNGIKILTNEEVESFKPIERTDPKGVAVMIKTISGKKFEADVVGVGIGIRSDFSWLEGSDIKINRAIVTNEYLETNLPDIYAAGDCAEFHDAIFEREHIMGNWANATSQGNAVGRTMSGQRTIFETASSYSINFFNPPTGGSCTFIGVTDEKFADEVIARGSIDANKMTQIYVKSIEGHRPGGASGPEGMRIVGATIVNNPAEVSPLTTAVKNKIDVSQFKLELSASDFDLKDLIEAHS